MSIMTFIFMTMIKYDDDDNCYDGNHIIMEVVRDHSNNRNGNHRIINGYNSDDDDNIN